MPLSTTSLDECLKAGRAVVALHVPWSIDAVRAAGRLGEIRDQLRSDLHVFAALLDEEDARTRDWLAAFKFPDLAAEYPRGAGSYLWLEDGFLVDYVLNPSQLSSDEIVAKTHRLWGGRIQRPIQPSDIIGETISRFLQTPWEHLDDYSDCNFYILFSDGTLVELGTFVLVDPQSTFANMLIDIEVKTDFSAFYCCDGFSGEGARIERVYGKVQDCDFYIQLSTGHWITNHLEECCEQLYLLDADEFVDEHDGMIICDYWTREPFTIGKPSTK